jgi:ribosomal protein L24
VIAGDDKGKVAEVIKVIAQELPSDRRGLQSRQKSVKPSEQNPRAVL